MWQRIGMAVVFALAGLAVLLAVRPAASAPTAQTIYVDPVLGSDTTGAGSQAAPWRSLKRALQAAVAGDTINALAGTYSTATGETFPINWLPGVKLSGAGRDVTIIQGQSDQPVIYIGSSSLDFYSDTVISQVTVRGGSEGIYLYSSQDHVNAATLLNLRASNNTDGIRIRTSDVYQNGATVTPLISATEAVSNTNQGFYFSGFGYFSSANIRPEVINCTARGNGAHGLYIDSAASSNNTTVAPHIVGSDFSDNHGSGVYATASFQGWASPQIERSTLTGNGGYGFSWVQGANRGNTTTVMTNTLIADNRAGGVYLGDVAPYEGGGGQVRLVNVTVADNAQAGIYWASGGGAVAPTVINAILWNPEADDLFATQGNWTSGLVQHSDIEDGDFGGQSGNFSADPLLDESYHLTACSPAIDAGTLEGAPSADFDDEARPQGLTPDVGLDELNTPCVLHSTKSVSVSQARYGDVLTYTLQITNTTFITTLQVALTDVLPLAVSYVPATLSASQGMPEYQAGVINWAGDLVPSETVTISLAAKVTHANTRIQNYFTAEAVGTGLHKSPVAVTNIAPALCYLPLIQRNYCAGPALDDFSNPASGWPTADTTYWSYGYTGGEYRFYANRSAFGAVSRGDKTGRFIVEVDARQVSAVNGSFGLIFQLADDWSDLYTFEIFPAAQQWAIFRNVNGQWSLLTYGSSSAIQPGHGTNRLRIAWLQQTVSFDDYGFYINGQAVFSSSFIYAPTPVRRVGLTATSDGAGFEARFDNYKFVAQGCPESPAARVSGVGPGRTERPLEQLPTIWQERLRGENLSSGRTPWRQSLYSESVR